MQTLVTVVSKIGNIQNYLKIFSSQFVFSKNENNNVWDGD